MNASVYRRKKGRGQEKNVKNNWKLIFFLDKEEKNLLEWPYELMFLGKKRFQLLTRGAKMCAPAGHPLLLNRGSTKATGLTLPTVHPVLVLKAPAETVRLTVIL
jgi:hypothetical protein